MSTFTAICMMRNMHHARIYSESAISLCNDKQKTRLTADRLEISIVGLMR